MQLPVRRWSGAEHDSCLPADYEINPERNPAPGTLSGGTCLIGWCCCVTWRSTKSQQLPGNRRRPRCTTLPWLFVTQYNDSNSTQEVLSPLIWVRRDWLGAPDSGCTSMCGGSWASRPERFSPCCWRSQLEVEAMSVMVEVVVEVLVVEVVVMVARGPQCHTACRFSPEATAPVKIAAPTYDDYTVLLWRQNVVAGRPEIREQETISFTSQYVDLPSSLDYMFMREDNQYCQHSVRNGRTTQRMTHNTVRSKRYTTHRRNIVLCFVSFWTLMSAKFFQTMF